MGPPKFDLFGGPKFKFRRAGRQPAGINFEIQSVLSVEYSVPTKVIVWVLLLHGFRAPVSAGQISHAESAVLILRTRKVLFSSSDLNT
jgi:hypothetical protein